MVKIPLTTEEVEALLLWRDNHKDLVRAGVIPFPECTIMCSNGLKIKVSPDDRFPAYNFVVTNCKEYEIIGRFSYNSRFQLVRQDFPALQDGEVQDCLTVWASAMAYIVNYQPREVERLAHKVQQAASGKSSHKGSKSSSCVIHLKDVVYRSSVEHGEHRPYTKPDHAFGVRGHYRHYKSGKVVYVQPFVKNAGAEKDDRDRIVKLDLEV